MSRHITMADVAREAGVSLMTVSRVVNQKEGVSQETRHFIQDIIRKMGYHPSSIARSLATQRTGTLGLVVPDISNPFFSGVAHGVERVAYAEGYSVLLCNTEEDPQRELDVLQLLEEKRVDGMILCSSRLEKGKLRRALAQQPAVVLVNRWLGNRRGTLPVGSVIVDDEAGAQMATQHLLNRGHRMIGFLSGPPNSYSGQGRSRGYQVALTSAGMTFRSEFTRSCPPTVEGGQMAACQLLHAHPEITALLCYNDLVAVGALQACSESSRTIPDDLAIVGYDDIFLAALVTPTLTTCRVSREELGRLSTRLLVDRMNGSSDGCEKIVLQPELVIRSSAP